MSSPSTIPLIPLLQELLRRQHQQDDQDEEREAAWAEACHLAVRERHDQLRAEYLQAARSSGAELTEEQEQQINDRAAQEAQIQVAQERPQAPRPRTPWEAALRQHLIPALQVAITDQDDPREQYDAADAGDEPALREYLTRLRLGGVAETTPLSAELARLDGDGFGNRLAELLCQEFPEEMREILTPFQSTPAPSTPPATEPATPPDGRPPLPPARHSLDFRSAHWYGTEYTFTKAQAAVVRLLWENWENGTPNVGHRTLLANARVDSDDLHDLFKAKGKPHPAWGAMIRSNVGSIGSKGTARLCPPDTPPS